MSLVGLDVSGPHDDSGTTTGIDDGGADWRIPFGSADGNNSMMDPAGESLPIVSKTK